MRGEWFEVGVRGIQDFGGTSVGYLHRIIQVCLPVIPLGFVVGHVRKESIAKEEQQTFSWRRPRNPERPATGPIFRARQKSRENRFTLGVAGPSIKFLPTR